MTNNNSSTTIYFIRHGDLENPKQVVYGRRDFPLSLGGKAQMSRLAKYLQALGVDPDFIYTSPLRRAQESAEKLQEVFDSVEIIEDENLTEIDVKAFEDRPLSWVWEIQRDLYSFAKDSGISIEFPDDIIRRMTTALDNILGKHADKVIFIVGHGDPISFLVWKLFHPDEQIPSLPLLSRGTFLRPAQCWELTFDEDGKAIRQTLISTM